MAMLIYSEISSLDGYVADADGVFGWAEPDEEVHTFINDLERPVGTYLYGRRMYETMAGWETAHTRSCLPRYILDFAEVWQAADKIVYSKTLKSVPTARTRIEWTFDPAAVQQLKATAARDITIGGPDLAAHAFNAGLIDACHLFIAPIVVGGGTRSLPTGVRVSLELLDVRRFGDGMAHLDYRTTPLRRHLRHRPVRAGVFGRDVRAPSATTDTTRCSRTGRYDPREGVEMEKIRQ